MDEEGVDRELADLTTRIAAVRAAIEREKDARASIEHTQVVADDAPDKALAALRDEVAAARAKLAKTTPRRRSAPSPTQISRRRIHDLFGAVLAVPGLLTVLLLLHDRSSYPQEPLAPEVVIVFAAPLLIGLALLMRARFVT